MSINVTGNLKYTLKVLCSGALKEMLSHSLFVTERRKRVLGYRNRKSGTAV